MDSRAETGDVTASRRAARRPGFIGEIAGGIAGAVLSAPEFAAAVLLASTLWIQEISLCVGVAHLGGMALSRSGPGRRVGIVAAWFGLTAVKWFVRADAPLRDSGFDQYVAIRVVAIAIAAAWAARSRRVWILAILVAATTEFVVWSEAAGHPRSITTTVVGSGLGSRVGLVLLSAGFAAVTFLLVALGRRGAATAAVVVVAVVVLASVAWQAAYMGAAVPPAYFVWWAVSLAATFIAMLIPMVCGMAARAAARDAAPDDGARLVVAIERRPWKAAPVLGVVLFYAVNTAEAFVPGGDDPASHFALLGRIASTSVLLAMVASGAAGSLGALAPLCTASAFALCAWSVSSLVAGPTELPDVIGYRAVRSAAYLVPQILTRGALARMLGIGRFAMPLLAVAFLLPQIAVSERVETSPWVGLVWVLVVAVTCVAVATGDAPASQIVVTAVVLGLLQRLAMELLAVRGHVQLGVGSWFELPIAWMLAAAFAVAARRVRTMTAIPLDHPVFVDFARTA
jgi:hypothetical protein